jgi:NH3-dependent NAD+ synthetase
MSKYLRIDEKRTVARLQTHIQDLFKASAASDALIGISGGIDSSVLSVLAVHAIGKGSVHLEYLYDQHSDPELRHNARLVSEWLGLELEESTIEPAMRKVGVYAPFGMMITSFSGLLNRFSQDHPSTRSRVKRTTSISPPGSRRKSKQKEMVAVGGSKSNRMVGRLVCQGRNR